MLEDEFRNRSIFLFQLSFGCYVVHKRSRGAKSVDDLLTSQSIRGLRFPNFEMFDAEFASVLKRISNPYFKRRISGKEQNAQAQDRFFLRGRHIVYMIYERFRVLGAHEAALDLCS